MNRAYDSSYTIDQLAATLRDAPTKCEARLDRALQQRFPAYKFESNVPLYGFIPDLYCKGLKLMIEVDGYSHAGREMHDVRRDKIFLQNGIITVRFSNERVLRDLAGVLDDVAIAIRGRRTTLGLPEIQIAVKPKLEAPPARSKYPSAGDACRNCGAALKLVIRHKEPPKQKKNRVKAYYYAQWLACQKCKSLFMNPMDEVWHYPRRVAGAL